MDLLFVMFTADFNQGINLAPLIVLVKAFMMQHLSII